MIVYTVNTDKQSVIEAYDFYLLLMRRKLSEGMTRKDASDYVFDAMELRYGIQRSRAVQIVYAMRRARAGMLDGADVTRLAMYHADNVELIRILNEVNEECAAGGGR